jgi:hypothetical protein
MNLRRDINWRFKYVTEEEVFLKLFSEGHGIPEPAC